MKLLGLGLGCAFVLGANGIHVREREHQFVPFNDQTLYNDF